MSKKLNRGHDVSATKPTPKKRDREAPAAPAGEGEGNPASASARRNSGSGGRESSRSTSSGGSSGNVGTTTHTASSSGTGSSKPSSALSGRGRRAEGRGANPAPASAAAGLCSSRSTPSLPPPSAGPLRSYRSLSRLDQGGARDEPPSARVMPNSRVRRGPPSSTPGAQVGSVSRSEADHLGGMDPSCPPSSSDVRQPHHHNQTRAEAANHKKGWMMRQDSEGQWQRHWFVLAHQTLSFYRDPAAEEAVEADGEMDLSTCYDVTEHPAHKNYGFQLHTRDGVHTLCALTFGTRQNWVQAVLTNVRPDLNREVKGVSNKSSGQDGGRRARRRSCDPSEATYQQPEEEEAQEQAMEAALLSESPSPAVSSSSSSGSLSAPSSSPVSRGLPYLEEEEEPEEEEEEEEEPEEEEEEGEPEEEEPEEAEELQEEPAMCHRRLPVATPSHPGGADPCGGVVRSPGSESDGSTGPPEPPPVEAEGGEAEGGEAGQGGQGGQQVEPSASISYARGTTREKEKPTTETETGQLLEELDQTQRELTRLQQLNKNLQDQLERERQYLLAGEVQNGASSSPSQATAFRRLQRINHDLGHELADQRPSQEEGKEAELRRRVELWAQQSQLQLTGDTAAPVCVQLEKDRRPSKDRQHPQDRKEEWERQITSLQSQLQQSEDQRREAERSLLKLQQEAQGHQAIQVEADRLREQLHEATLRLRSNEEAQAHKEVRLQKHLVLLQESQDRERRRLASGLDQAERLSLDLQEKLDRAEQQVQSLSKGPSWTRDIQEAQQQLQEELVCTVAAVQTLQDEREQLRCHCQELENQLGEVDAEVSRLKNRLKTEETDYYNLEHSFERVSEDLQLALGKVEEREGELQEIREGYERLLDRKEQELSEVLVKMEILGNSLEETEVKLSEVLKVSSCASPEQDQSVISVKYDQRQKDEAPLELSNGLPKVRSHSLTSTGLTGIEVNQQNIDPSDEEHARSRSRSIDPSFQYFVTNEEDQDRFMAVIQVLETKLYVTEEKLRNITQRLEDHQSHMICQDPHLCSQLTQSKATAQHLSLLLHKQAKQNQRFAKQTESRSRLLVHTFQAALTTVEAARQTLFALHHNLKDGHNRIDATELEKQLATVAACLHQGEKNAEEQQQESYYSIREESRINRNEASTGDEMVILSDTASEVPSGSAGRLLMNEALLVENMILALQNREGMALLQPEPSTHVGDVVQRLKRLTSQIIDLKKELHSGESLKGAIGRVCAEAEVIYTAFKLQGQYETYWQAQEKCPDTAVLTKTSLADVWPPELAPREEQIDPEDGGREEASESINKEKEDKEQQVEARLVYQLQRRAQTLRKLCKELCDSEAGSESSVDQNIDTPSTADSKWVREQTILIYLYERLYLDFNLEMQQRKEEHNRLRALSQEQEAVLLEEQKRCSRDLEQLRQEKTVLRTQLEELEEKRTVAEAGNQQLLENIQTIENDHKERIIKLEKEFQEKIKELQRIHEEEMKHLVVYFSKSASVSDSSTSPSDTSKLNAGMGTGGPEESSSGPEGQQAELETECQTAGAELGGQMVDSDDTSTMRKAYQADFEKLKASCDQGISAMEEMYRRLVEDLRQQHHREVAELLKEKEELLEEETAATMAAIVAMKRAHQEELRRSQQSQQLLESGDLARLHAEHQKELQALREELEVLSLQHTHRCLEYAEVVQELQRERRAGAPEESQGPGNQELQEAELNRLRQEAQRLREELKTALTDKAHPQNMPQATSQSSSFWSRSDKKPPVGQDDIIVAKTDSACRRKKSFTQRIRERSKSLKEGLSVQERRKLFESS